MIGFKKKKFKVSKNGVCCIEVLGTGCQLPVFFLGREYRGAKALLPLGLLGAKARGGEHF